MIWFGADGSDAGGVDEVSGLEKVSEDADCGPVLVIFGSEDPNGERSSSFITANSIAQAAFCVEHIFRTYVFGVSFQSPLLH